MKRILNKEIHENHKKMQQVLVQGWVKSNRNNGAFGFIDFTDGSSFETIQIVYKKELLTNFEDFKNVTTGSAIEVDGKIVLTPNSKQPFEIVASKVSILALADSDFPLQKKRHTNEYLREIAHLRPRTNLFSVVMRIRSVLYQLLNNYFLTNNFIWVASPELTSTDAEGNGEAFNLATVNKEEFFGGPVSLSGTGQLHAEAYAMAFSAVYSFAPQFRAEKSHTNRHAAEFWMLEPEVAFMDVFGVMDLMEDMLKNVVGNYSKQCQSEITFLNTFIDEHLNTRLHQILEMKFPRIEYTKAIEILTKVTKAGHKFENNKIFWGMDLESEHERYLSEVEFNSPIFVYNYPTELKAFYMKQNADMKTVAGVDFLVPGVGELCGGSERENNYEKLLKRAQDLNIPFEGMQWYLDLRKYGYYKSAGFGLGFERLIMYLTGVSNIKDTIPFPRSHGNIKF